MARHRQRSLTKQGFVTLFLGDNLINVHFTHQITIFQLFAEIIRAFARIFFPGAIKWAKNLFINAFLSNAR